MDAPALAALVIYRRLVRREVVLEAFLMPELSVRGRMPNAPLLDQVVKGRNIWRVSALALTYRLRELCMFTDEQYRTTCVELSRLGYRQAEFSGLIGESSQLLGKVFAALKDQGTSMRDLAAEVYLSPDDLAGMVFGLVVTAVGSPGRANESRRDLDDPPSSPARLTLA